MSTKSGKATASDVAIKAGVSKWTVSRAFIPGSSISESAKSKVLKASEELGYRPNLLARSLSKKSTSLIGVVVDNLENSHKLMMLNEITKALQARGKIAMVLNISEQESNHQLLYKAEQLQVDGLIFLGTSINDNLLNYAVNVKHIPLVVLGRGSEIHHVDVVNSTDMMAGQEIAQLFLKTGFTKLGYVSGPDSGGTELGRLKGFKSHLKEHNIELFQTIEAGQYVRTNGYEAMNLYLSTTDSQNRVEALFCENDILAIGCLDSIKQFKAHIAIIGFDDIDMASSPAFSLTTYRPPLEKMAHRAIDMIESKILDCHEELVGELVIRESHLPRC